MSEQKKIKKNQYINFEQLVETKFKFKIIEKKGNRSDHFNF